MVRKVNEAQKWNLFFSPCIVDKDFFKDYNLFEKIKKKHVEESTFLCFIYFCLLNLVFLTKKKKIYDLFENVNNDRIINWMSCELFWNKDFKMTFNSFWSLLFPDLVFCFATGLEVIFYWCNLNKTNTYK